MSEAKNTIYPPPSPSSFASLTKADFDRVLNALPEYATDLRPTPVSRAEYELIKKWWGVEEEKTNVASR